MKNNLIGLTVALVVGIIMVGSLVAPTITALTDETKTYYNDGVPYTIADEDDTTEHTMLISLVDDAYVVTLDGETVDISYFSSAFTLIFGEHSILRYTPTAGVLAFGGTMGDGTSQIWKSFDAPTDGNPVTITIVGTTATVVGLMSEASTTYEISENFAYVSNDGEYRYGYNPCVTSDTVIYGGGVTFSPFSSATVISFSGTVDDLTAGLYRSSPMATLDDVTVNTSTVESNLLQIDSIVFDCTQSDTSKTATYTYFLAPYEIVYDNPDYVGSTLAPIMLAIIVVTILALVMMAARNVTRD